MPVSSIPHLTVLLSGCGGAFVFSPSFHLCSETMKTGGSSTRFLHRQTLSGLFHLSACTQLGWSGRAGTACIAAAMEPSVVDSLGDIQLSFVFFNSIFEPKF